MSVRPILATAVSACALAAAQAAAQGVAGEGRNSVLVVQGGAGNRASVSQISPDMMRNAATIHQLDSVNASATINQSGADGTAAITQQQVASADRGMPDMPLGPDAVGTGYAGAMIQQGGAANVAAIGQGTRAGNAYAEISQSGNGNSATIHQDNALASANFAGIYQSGDGISGTVSQDGDQLTGTLVQTLGTGTATLAQSGSDLSLQVTQTPAGTSLSNGLLIGTDLTSYAVTVTQSNGVLSVEIR